MCISWGPLIFLGPFQSFSIPFNISAAPVPLYTAIGHARTPWQFLCIEDLHGWQGWDCGVGVHRWKCHEALDFVHPNANRTPPWKKRNNIGGIDWSRSCLWERLRFMATANWRTNIQKDPRSCCCCSNVCSDHHWSLFAFLPRSSGKVTDRLLTLSLLEDNFADLALAYNTLITYSTTATKCLKSESVTWTLAAGTFWCNAGLCSTLEQSRVPADYFMQTFAIKYNLAPRIGLVLICLPFAFCKYKSFAKDHAWTGSRIDKSSLENHRSTGATSTHLATVSWLGGSPKASRPVCTTTRGFQRLLEYLESVEYWYALSFHEILFNSLQHSAGPSGCCQGGRKQGLLAWLTRLSRLDVAMTPVCKNVSV